MSPKLKCQKQLKFSPKNITKTEISQKLKLPKHLNFTKNQMSPEPTILNMIGFILNMIEFCFKYNNQWPTLTGKPTRRKGGC